MSLFNVFQVSGTAVAAQSQRLNVVASNLANADSVAGPDGQPGHPLADQDGYVTMSNVNVVDEMVNMISASRSYQTNIDVMTTTKSMLQQTLQLGN